MFDEFIQAEQLVISDLETLKVLADPLRMQVLQLLLKPKTVKEVAARSEMPPTRLSGVGWNTGDRNTDAV